jgi:hypothetical protein
LAGARPVCRVKAPKTIGEVLLLDAGLRMARA